MEKKFIYKESRGLPGGPNEYITHVSGIFSTEGYKRNSPDVNNPYNIIPSGNITMKGVDFPVMGTDNLGNTKAMIPGNDYKFPGDVVFETPMAQNGIEVPKRQGARKNPDGTESTHLMATETLDGKNWVSFPTLFQDPDGTWIDMSDKPWKEAYEEAKKRGELIDFGTDKEAAIKFGEGSWKPKMKRGGGLLTQTMKCNSCGWSWKAADGGSDLTTCHKCGGEAKIKAQDGKETSWSDYINPMNWGVTNRDDDGDFKQAFRAARIDGDDEFMWHGERYSTELKAQPKIEAKPATPKPKELNIEGLKKGIAQAESLGGVLMVNPESTATGLYGQRFSELKGKDIYKGTREDFAKDLDAQNRVFELRLNQGINGKRGLIQDAEDIYSEYAPQIKNFDYSKEDLIALTNFLGRQGTRQYLGYHVRDGKPLNEALPNLYSTAAKQANKTPSEYLKVIREYYQDGGEGGNETTEANFLKNWFANRTMPTPEGQKLLEKVRPEAMQRASQNVPYIMTDQLPENVAGYYDTKDKNIYLNQTYTPEQINSTKEHERVHYVQDGDKFYKVLDTPHTNLVEQNIKQPKEINTGNPQWDKNVKENYDDIVAQEEIHARIMTLRRLAGFKPDQVITEEMLNSYFNSVKESGKALDPDIEDLKAVTKGNSSIVNLLNDMVSAPQKKDIVSYAQEGGEIDEFEMYKNYIDGKYDGTDMEEKASKVYDKLNRVYYKQGKESGTTIPNYILSTVINQTNKA
jgi:hypothetical protein